MNDWSPILRAAKRSLVALAVVGVVSAVAVLGLQWWSDSLKSEVTQQQMAVQSQRAQLSSKQEDLRNVRSHIKRFEALRAQGLVGTPDRPMWVEELQASHARMGLRSALVYQLQVPKTVVDINAGTLATPSGASLPDGTTNEPLFHDLQLEVRETHEDELLQLIQDYRQHVVGRFRVNACTFMEANENGLKAQCVLRFVTVPLPQTAASAP